MSGVVPSEGSWQNTTLARRELHDSSGVSLQPRRTSSYISSTLSMLFVRRFEGDSLYNEAAIMSP